MIRKAARAAAVLACVISVLGMAGSAVAVDAPKWVAVLYVEQQKMVGLRWMPVPGATGYKVFKTTTPGKNQQEIASVATPQHLDAAVEPGGTYYYSLKAVVGSEVGPSSDEKSVSIPGVQKSGVETPELDSATLQTTMEFGKPIYKVGVFWRGRGPAIAYNLYRSLESGKQGEMVASSQDQRYVDVAVEPGKTYYYTVTALDAGFQETKPSVEKSVEVKPPEAVPENAPVAAPVKKKEYPKLVPIPINKGEIVRLPNAPLELLFKDGALIISAAGLYKIDSPGGKIVEITATEVSKQVLGIGLGLDGEILAVCLGPTQFVIMSGNKVTAVDIPPLEKGLVTSDGREVPIKPTFAVDVTQNIDGKYWITDNANNRIVILDENRKFLKQAAAGTPREHVSCVTSIEHDSKGNVFAIVGSENEVNIYDKEGNWVDTFGETGNIASTFGRVGGIFVDKNDHLWITDTFNGTIQEFDNTGKFVGAISSADGKSGLGVATPASIAIDGKEGYIAQAIGHFLVPFTFVPK